MKRIQRGPVRGISLKLQEEERERRLDFVPGVSALDTESIEVDKDTMEMLKQIGMDRLPNVKLPTVLPLSMLYSHLHGYCLLSTHIHNFCFLFTVLLGAHRKPCTLVTTTAVLIICLVFVVVMPRAGVWRVAPLTTNAVIRR
jgi:hypothetical protein